MLKKIFCPQTMRLIHLMPRIAYYSDSMACKQLPLKTPLIDFHMLKKGRMVDFCGYILPQQYEDQTILDSHCFVRDNCGLFDVSHMLQTRLVGEHRYELIESLSTASMAKSTRGCSALSLFLNGDGGIMDDFIVCNCKENYLYIVSNAACSRKISEHLLSHVNRFNQEGKNVNVYFLERALIAVQGPKAFSILGDGISSSEKPLFNDLYFMESAVFASLFGITALEEDDAFRITRCGYTGEDGYEISLPSELAKSVVDQLMQNEQVIRPIGLAARDTLRLEAGMCLYGHELSESTTPAEAGLGWLVGKKRREPSSTPRFPGFEKVMSQLASGATLGRRRVGLSGAAGPQARQGAEIFTTSLQRAVGQVTSGCLSPSLGHNVAMAYVKPEYSQLGEQLTVRVRNKFYPFTVTSLPFVPNRYVRRPKARPASGGARTSDPGAK